MDLFFFFIFYYLTPNDFLSFVLSRPVSLNEEPEDCVWTEDIVGCLVVPRRSPRSLQAAMQLVNIQTVAFTPPHALPWRVFLYTHTLRASDTPGGGSTLVLGELLYATEAKQKGSADRQAEVTEEPAGNGEQEVKVTLRQQPGDAEALRAFLSVLTSVLRALSSEEA